MDWFFGNSESPVAMVPVAKMMVFFPMPLKQEEKIISEMALALQVAEGDFLFFSTKKLMDSWMG